VGFTQPAAKIVPKQTAEKSPLDTLAVGDTVGAFTGYLRRPKPSGEGMTALFFGENGQDSDIISVFHLSRYLDALVKVTVWMIKDFDGRVMRKNGAYPEIATFIASVKRPVPSKTGQMAQFFGANGSNSDAIAKLNQTEYLDSMVFVEIQKAEKGMTATEIKTHINPEDLQAEEQRRTPKETGRLKQEQMKAADGLRLLLVGGFFRNEMVLAALGSPGNFEEWITKQGCCHPGTQPCDHHPIEVFRLPQSNKPYSAVPFCSMHAKEWGDGTVALDPGVNALGFLNSRKTALVQRFATERLRETLHIPAGYDPTPSAIYTWAVDAKVQTLIPSAFQGLF
jgi:hypothetical protein